MVSALSATPVHVPITLCESSPSTPSTMTSATTFSNASLDNHSPTKANGDPPRSAWNHSPSNALEAPRINGQRSSEFPALAEATGSPTWANKSGGNTRASSVNGRDDKSDEPTLPPSGSGKKNKWVPIPAAEMQAALDQAHPPRSHSHSHSRNSSRRNSPGELRRGRRLPDDQSYRRKSGFTTPTFGSGSVSVSKPGTANPSPGPGQMSRLPPPPEQQPPPALIKRKTPRLSAPVTAVRPIPPLPAEGSRSRFGTIDTPSSPPPDSDNSSHSLDRHPKQPGRFGVAVGVPLAERAARRTAARRPLSTANDIEDDWTGDGRWNFGIIGTFDRRAPLSRSQQLHTLSAPQQQQQPMLHSPRARGTRGRGMTRGFRGRGYPGGYQRGSPADQEFAMLPPPGPMPPMDPYNPYAFNPYAYQGYVPVPPMWNPYAPYGVMPPPPPPPMLGAGGSGAAPPPVPVTNLGYMLDPMRYYVLGQIEYYFSVQNMCQDLYLRQQMDTQGWIPIVTICSFNRLRKLTQDIHLVREMMQLSSLVEVSADGDKARMSNGVWATFVLPDAQEASAGAGAAQSVEGDVSFTGGEGGETSGTGTSAAGGTSPATSMDATEEKSALGLVGVGAAEGGN